MNSECKITVGVDAYIDPFCNVSRADVGIRPYKRKSASRAILTFPIEEIGKIVRNTQTELRLVAGYPKAYVDTPRGDVCA